MATSAPVGVNASIVGENPTGLGIYSVNLARALDQVRDDLIVYTSYPKALGGLRARLARAPAVVRPGRGFLGHFMRLAWLQILLRLRARADGLGLLLNTGEHAPEHRPALPASPREGPSHPARV